MPDVSLKPPFDRILATADAIARERPEADPGMIREVFLEAAMLLDNGLVLDALDDHDADAVVAGLCVDLVADDPGAAVHARARSVREMPGDLHDPEGVAAAYLTAAALFQL